jgi:hypothetical protein
MRKVIDCQSKTAVKVLGLKYFESAHFHIGVHICQEIVPCIVKFKLYGLFFAKLSYTGFRVFMSVLTLLDIFLI